MHNFLLSLGQTGKIPELSVQDNSFVSFKSNPLIQLSFKLLHIVAVIMFLGNIVTGLFWMRIAMRTKDMKLIAHSMNGIIRSDRLFTIPGVFLIIIGGIGAAIQAQLPLLRTGWIFWSLVLFTISGIAFALKVAPLQKKTHRYASSADAEWESLKKIYTEWEYWGLISLLTPLVALVMMVLKRPVESFLFS